MEPVKNNYQSLPKKRPFAGKGAYQKPAPFPRNFSEAMCLSGINHSEFRGCTSFKTPTSVVPPSQTLTCGKELICHFETKREILIFRL
jgi:hypothetical protein